MAKKYTLLFTKEAKKDIAKLTPKLKTKLYKILTEVIALTPYSGKKLVGDLKGFYAYRLNYKDRIVYTIEDNKLLVTIYKTKTHYRD